MDDSIGHLHCSYRVIGNQASTGQATAYLDRLAHQRLAQACAEALDQALGSDPAVYVLRRVNAELTFRLDSQQNEAHLAQRWGERLTEAVVRSIATDPGDATNLVRFADHADYVAHFVADLLQGVAWSRWFYRPFAAWRPYSVAKAVGMVLLENRQQLSVILRYLQRNGTLSPLLTMVDETMLQVLWSQGLRTDLGLDMDTARPLLAGALCLVDRLQLWSRSRPADTTLLHLYLATAPPPPDWRDRRGLAAAVFDILRFLTQQGYLRRSRTEPDEVWQFRLTQALNDFDWLDAEWLQSSIINVLCAATSRDTDLPVRPAGGDPTPRQLDLLTDLIAAWRDGGVRLDRSHPTSAANALRWYAALIARAPRWADDPIATGVLERLLAAWAWLLQARSPAEALRQLRRGKIDTTLLPAPQGHQPSALATLKSLARLGQPGLTLIEALIDSSPSSIAGAQVPGLAPIAGHRHAGLADAGIDTAAAGVFLLLRAILDARLPWVVESVDYPSGGLLPSLQAMLIALGLRWAGVPGGTAGSIDPGLCVLAGAASPVTLEALRGAWQAMQSTDHVRFQAALLAILAGQRVVRGSVLHLHGIPTSTGATALVASDETTNLWPLGRLLTPATDVRTILTEWLAVWEGATGRRPALIIGDESLLAVIETEWYAMDIVAVPESDSHNSGETVDEREAQHRSSRDMLLAALEALDHGPLGLPDSDLVIALTAITLLRLWARWLGKFAASSIPYLLSNFIRRSGRLVNTANGLLIEMPRQPLDLVMDMAGYTAELERVPWLNWRAVRFQLGGA